MPGVINTGTHPKLLWPGVHAIWGQVYNQHPTEYTDLFDQLTSDQAYEEEVQVAGPGLASIKTEGAPYTSDGEIQGAIARYVPIAYALGYAVTFEELEDNKYEQVASRRAKANAFSMAQTVENVAAFLYNNAFVTTYFTTADAVALCSTAHVNAHGGTFSNMLSVGADLVESSLEDATVQLMGMTDDNGLPISVMPKSLHVPRQEIYNAARILRSVQQSGSANNDINALNALNVFPGGAKVCHYFTNADDWFIRTNVMQGMQMFWRRKPMFDQDNDFATKNALACSYMRFSVGCTDPRAIFGSAGA